MADLRSTAIAGAAAGIVAGLALATPLAFGADGALQATVTVIPDDAIIYGAEVFSCDMCLDPGAATGAPDGEGALLFHNGGAALELSSTVSGSPRLSIWAKSLGWGPTHARVYVSDDGKKWKHAGNTELTPEFEPLEFESTLDSIRFVKVERNGWVLGALALDALGADGGGR